MHSCGGILRSVLHAALIIWNLQGAAHAMNSVKQGGVCVCVCVGARVGLGVVTWGLGGDGACS